MDIEEKVDMILRQTNYDKTTAQQKLIECDNDAIHVIRAYLNADKVNTAAAVKLSTNQQIYKEIRGMMDDAAKKYQETKKNTAS
jgi:hypothetical protein